MKILGFEIKRVKRLNATVKDKGDKGYCFKCGRAITIRGENMRAYNYCQGCR